MAIQSCTPAIVLTRPAPQSQRFARDLSARLGNIRVVISPLMKTVRLRPDILLLPYKAVIFTSETGVQAAAELPVALPKTAFCVGTRTATAAQQAGFEAQSADGDVVALARMIREHVPTGPLLHLRGRDAAGDLAEVLTKGGIEMHSAVVYTQEPQPLNAEALALFAQSDPVILPLFSPRSALLLSQALPKPLTSPLWVIAISQNAADAAQSLSPKRMVIAARPDGENMLQAVTEVVQAVYKP